LVGDGVGDALGFVVLADGREGVGQLGVGARCAVRLVEVVELPPRGVDQVAARSPFFTQFRPSRNGTGCTVARPLASTTRRG
jgi:hypothetical protein